jgi:hypothetical protein
LSELDEETLPHPGFYSNRAKARDILLDRGAPSALLSGPKVTAFYACLSGDTERVTIDRHAATLAYGARVPSLPKRLGDEMRRAYAICAEWLGIAPRDLQSLLWCDHKARRAEDAARAEQPTFFETPGRAVTLTDLALGWSDDPARAFLDAPAEPVSKPEPDPKAPLIERASAVVALAYS